MVDHTFLFTGAVKKIRELVEEGALGKLYYYDSTRVNLGLFQHDINVIWDLAPHDLSIMDYLIKETPEAVVATGQTHLNGFEDVAFMTLYFPDKVIAHINVNWLSPVKVRTTLIGGEKKMLVWNDLEADEKIKIYDRGVQITNRQDLYDLVVNYRSGDVCPPRHPLGKTRAVGQICPYRGLAPLRSFVEAIAATRPDLILPGDDLATRHLHHLCRREHRQGRAGSAICQLIERSLGAPESFSVVYARTAFMQLAQEEGIRIPRTEIISNTHDLRAWVARMGFPTVLKADCTSGGEGVRVVHTIELAE